MEKERRKGTWRQVALLLLVAAFLVSGTGIFKKKIEENRQQDIQRQEVEKAFEQMMAAQADGGADAGKGQTKGQKGFADGQTTERTRVRGSRPRRSPGMNISGIRSLSEIPGLWDLWNTGRFRELPFSPTPV